jgi:alanine-glyoxylate transaminase/serine-glyoxylate transaminase/serine-pyruvate transaminase
MSGREFVFVPGPTNIPDRVVRAMMAPMEDHRSSRFPEITFGLLRDLKKVFKTNEGRSLIFSSSGTGGWEAALANTLSPGDKVLAARLGHFSDVSITIAQRLGLDVQIVDEVWGSSISIPRIEGILRADRKHAIKGVCVVHNETTTGVTSDIAGIRQAMDAAGHPSLLYVDGISSIGSIDFRMDEWGVDLAVAGSQKGFMLPPGLALIAVSPKAAAACKRAGCRRAYFDFCDMLEANKSGYFPHTPPISLLHGLRESLNMMFEETLDGIFERHRRLAQGVRAAVQAWRLRPVALDPRRSSDTVTAVHVPAGFDSRDVVDAAFRRYQLALGAGLSRFTGKVFRIGHLGDLNELMVLGALAGVEMAMCDVGIDIELGSGIAAAARDFRTYWHSTRSAASAAAASRGDVCRPRDHSNTDALSSTQP